MADHPSRRQLLVSTGALGLTACAGRRNSPFWSTVTGAGSGESAASTRAYAEALPYASMMFWPDGQAKSLIVLGTVDPDHRFTWYTASKQAITTYGAFIVATRGTEIELRETAFGPGWSRDPLSLIGKTLERETVVANLSQGSTEKRSARATLRSSFHAAGYETITILDQNFELYRVDETVTAERRVRFLNSYWISANSGACYKSRQNTLPTLQPLNIEMLKFPPIAA